MRSTVAVTIALTWPAFAAGQGLGESEVLARISPAHPALAAPLSQLGKAQAHRQLAAAPGDIHIATLYEDSGGAERRQGATVAFRPPLDGRRRLAVGAAEAGVEAAAAALAAERLRLRAQVRAAFAHWWAAWEASRLLHAQAAELAALAERARRRALAGEESGLAGRRLAAESAQAASEAAFARAEGSRARGELLTWVGELPAAAFPLPPPLPPDPGPLEDCRPPQLEALAGAVRQARHERELAARVWQFPELTAGWQRVDDGGVAHWGVLAGAQWRLPLPRPTRAGIAAAKAELAAAEGELQLGRARIAAELASAREAYATLRASAEAAAAATADAEPMVTAAVASFTAGESAVTDLLDTLRAALALRRGAVETHGAALASHRLLEQACGRELPLGGQP